MDKIILTEEQHNQRELALEGIFNQIKTRIDKEATQIAIDKDRMNFLISSDEATYAIDVFWKYFKTKYQIDDIEKFYTSKVHLMQDIYVRCLIPFNLELDVKYGSGDIKKEDIVYGIARFGLWVADLFQRFYLSIIAFASLFVMIYLSFYFIENDNQWLSSLFLGAASSILAALIVTFINRQVKNAISHLEFQDRYIRNEVTRYLNIQKNDIESIKVNHINDGKFLLDIVNINNTLKQHLRLMSKFPRITTQEYYIDLKSIEKKMFEKSSEYVRGEFFKEHQKPTLEDKDELLLLVFELQNSSEYYKQEVDEYLYSISKSLNRITKKAI
jgi:hypothetical protein